MSLKLPINYYLPSASNSNTFADQMFRNFLLVMAYSSTTHFEELHSMLKMQMHFELLLEISMSLLAGS